MPDMPDIPDIPDTPDSPPGIQVYAANLLHILEFKSLNQVLESSPWIKSLDQVLKTFYVRIKRRIYFAVCQSAK